MGAIYRRELGSFFNSAIGPVFLTVFYLGSGVLFWLFCLNYARTDMSNYFAWMRLVMVLILPLLTMRLLSEERAQKTVLGIVSLVVLYMIDYLSGTVSSSADSLSSKSTVLSTLVGWLGNAMESVSFFSRIYDFTYGLFNLSSVLLYISTAVLFNFFTVRVFETRRWR